MAASNPDIQWPPRSPHEARMSTPGGRNKFRQLARQTSPSPSPAKRSRTLHVPAAATPSDEEEDEETLQLKLQEIQARLRLKKLQKAKEKDVLPKAEDNQLTTSTAVARLGAKAITQTEMRLTARREPGPANSRSNSTVHVPVSPVRKITAPVEHVSPTRVLMGIDKGLKGRDVSLRRAPDLGIAPDNPTGTSNQLKTYLARNNAQSDIRVSNSRLQTSLEDAKPLTFSERMADVRNAEVARKEREQKIKGARSKAFDIDEAQMASFRRTAETIPTYAQAEPEFSRDQVLSSFTKPANGVAQRNRQLGLPQHNTTSRQPSIASTRSRSSETQAVTNPRFASSFDSSTSESSQQRATRSSNLSRTTINLENSTEFESFSSSHLCKRIIPHTTLAREFSDKKVMLLPDLLSTCKAPDFSLPDIEQDIVLLATIASKSDPRAHKAGNASIQTGPNQRSKYMVLTLTDLKWEVSLYLFNTGFERFWKLDVGTVVAILNPEIMAPQNVNTGRFSITINNSDTVVLEIGTSRDLGFCKSIKKDGKTCDSWVDKRHTEFCEYHVNEGIKKTLAGRMEVNGFGGGLGKRTGGGEGWQKWKRSTTVSGGQAAKTAEDSQGVRYVKDVGKIHFARGLGSSTASLLDDPYHDPDAFHFGSKDERLRKRRADQEREREISKKLGEGLGVGLGADYMRSKNQTSRSLDPNYQAPDAPPLPDAKALGLLDGKASGMILNPIKRKRTGEGSQSSSVSSNSNTGPRGWGGSLSKDLERMGKGESLAGDNARVKKRTRLYLPEKGIRLPGRESLGTWLVDGKEGGEKRSAQRQDDDDDDDDDDLEIV